jgi:hypothetical protein
MLDQHAADSRSRDSRCSHPLARQVGVVAGAFLLLSLVSAPAAQGQSPAPMSHGTKSISFGIDGSGSAEAGIWTFISDRSNVGLIGTLDWRSEDRDPQADRSEFTLGIGPRLKWYLDGSPRVAPFWYGGLDFRHTRRKEDDEDERSSRGLGLDGGFGVDWFPVGQISIGGWTGLRLTSDRAENDNTTTRLRTLTTGLRMHIYF